MSEANSDALDSQADVENASVEERLRRLENDLAAEREQRRELENQNEELRSRVSELETELGERATIQWDSEDFEDAELQSTAGMTLPFGSMIRSKVSEYEYEKQYENLQERVEAIETGEAEVVINSELDRDPLPIESLVADLKHGNDPEGNKKRAAMVFPKFYSKSRSWSGKLKLDSDGVRSILEDKSDRDAEDWNYNTIRRTMKQLAKHTSSKDKNEWDAKDEENLITLETGGKRNELVADKEEFEEFLQDAAGASEE